MSDHIAKKAYYSIGDVCDLCPRYVTPGGVGIQTGNTDPATDSVINSADIIYMVNYVFKGGPEPLPIKQAGDVNFDLSETSADIIYLVNFVLNAEIPQLHSSL